MSTSRHTVLLADDHTMVREGLVRLLEEHDFKVVAAVGDGWKLVEEAKRLRPEVIVTDITMPGPSGLEVLARLKTERVASKVIVLTMHNDLDLATRAIRAGAFGYLLKDSAGEELVVAIRQVLQGWTYLTPVLTRGVMDRLAVADVHVSSKPVLTARQRDVLRLVAQGKRMKEVAGVLKLSTRTVETHKYEMMQVLGLHSTAELVRYALEQGLLDD